MFTSVCAKCHHFIQLKLNFGEIVVRSIWTLQWWLKWGHMSNPHSINQYFQLQIEAGLKKFPPGAPDIYRVHENGRHRAAVVSGLCWKPSFGIGPLFSKCQWGFWGHRHAYNSPFPHLAFWSAGPHVYRLVPLLDIISALGPNESLSRSERTDKLPRSTLSGGKTFSIVSFDGLSVGCWQAECR